MFVEGKFEFKMEEFQYYLTPEFLNAFWFLNYKFWNFSYSLTISSKQKSNRWNICTFQLIDYSMKGSKLLISSILGLLLQNFQTKLFEVQIQLWVFPFGCAIFHCHVSLWKRKLCFRFSLSLSACNFLFLMSWVAKQWVKCKKFNLTSVSAKKHEQVRSCREHRFEN